MPLWWFLGGSTSADVTVFSTGIITVSGTITGLPAGNYVISILPAKSNNHRLVHADPLPSASISSSSPAATVTFATTYALGTRMVTW